MSNDQTTTPIPVSAGQRIAEEFGYDQVVIVARKVGVTEHVTTYGAGKEHSEVAKRIGRFFAYKLMGWPAPAPAPDERVEKHMREVREYGQRAITHYIDCTAATSVTLRKQREQEATVEASARALIGDLE